MESDTEDALRRRGTELLGMILLGLAALAFVTVWSYSPDDPSLFSATEQAPRNALGLIGASLADPLHRALGWAAYGIAVALGVWGLRLVFHADGDTQTFEPFDRWGHTRDGQGRPLDQLLDEFARMRGDNLAELRALNLAPEDLERRGRHPAFGVVSLSELLATWAAHDLTHLHQISRVMAHQYREKVGPWSQYLGVLHCAGHTAS
jgi:hypothetical protein